MKLVDILNINLNKVSNAGGVPGLFQTPENNRHLIGFYDGYISGLESAKKRLMKEGMQDGPQPLSLTSSLAETFPAANNFATSPPMSLGSVPVSAATALMTPSASSTTTPTSPNISSPPTVTTISQPITASSDVSQNTAISDRPKAKPVSKKEGKNIRKVGNTLSAKLQQQQATLMAGLQQQYQQKQRQHTYQVQQVHQLQQLNQQLQLQLDQVQVSYHSYTLRCFSFFDLLYFAQIFCQFLKMIYVLKSFALKTKTNLNFCFVSKMYFVSCCQETNKFNCWR